jgi:glycosyltransferase involved in cell wall biosynthesis
MELGIDSKVEFMGWVEDVRGLLRKTDIFILTSWYEGQPNALLEAMSESVPCISTDFIGGAAQELLGENAAGIVVPVRDTLAISEAMASLLSDRGLRDDFGAKAREVVSSFRADRIAERWIDTLDLD